MEEAEDGKAKVVCHHTGLHVRSYSDEGYTRKQLLRLIPPFKCAEKQQQPLLMITLWIHAFFLSCLKWRNHISVEQGSAEDTRNVTRVSNFIYNNGLNRKIELRTRKNSPRDFNEFVLCVSPRRMPQVLRCARRAISTESHRKSRILVIYAPRRMFWIASKYRCITKVAKMYARNVLTLLR